MGCCATRVAGRGALILHPGECFFGCFLKKFLFTRNDSEDGNAQQKQRCGITGSPVLLIVDHGRDMAQCLTGFLPGWSIPAGCSPSVFDPRIQQCPGSKSTNPLYRVPGIPSLQFVEVHEMVRGYCGEVLQVQPPLPMLPLSNLWSHGVY